MPSNSKQKKHSNSNSKAQSRVSTPEPPAPRAHETNEAELASLCEEASRKFPSLIGKSAFVGHVSDVERAPNSKGSKIWLSETSMVSSSLAPGSIVSMSIASLRKKGVQLDSFPLKSLHNECVRCLGLENGKISDDEAGNYFALATVFPSSKVLKDEVRLSSHLSYTMGCPSLGTIVFVYSVQKQYLSCLANGSNEQHSTGNNCLSIYNCKELYLQLAPHKNELPSKFNKMPSLDSSAAKSHVQSDNDIVASPRTPSSGSKFSNASSLSSPIFEDSASSVPNQNSQSMASFDVREALGDESAKKLLQTCATSWLYSHCLLIGNLVNVPMFSELCIFQVIGAKKVSVERSNQSNGSINFQPEDSDIAENVNQAIVVNCETKIFLSLPSHVASEEPIQRDLSIVKLKHKVASASICDSVSKLGGLSKEYTVLQEIISSSVKDTLSSHPTWNISSPFLSIG